MVSRWGPESVEGPDHRYHTPEAPETAGKPAAYLARVSFIWGVLWLAGLGSVFALIYGYAALGKSRKAGGPTHGLYGIIVGWAGLAAVLGLILAYR